MIEDELRAAAERLQQAYADHGPDSRRFRAEDVNDVSHACLAGPRWHDKPPVPGVYVGRDTLGEIPPVAIEFTQADLDGGRPARRESRWFGPIPPDPG